MNNNELFEAMKRNQEYTLMEVRLSAEDVKNAMREELGTRITHLETWRTYLHGIVIGLGMAWGLFEAGAKYLKMKALG